MLRHIVSSVILAFIFQPLLFGSVPEDTINVQSPLPVDPEVTIDTLDNGLVYYVRENNLPENRVEMRQILNAGSLQEKPDQRGLAHFCEHMAFNGTKHFEENELVDILEKMGIRFGADLNAYTSFGETVYRLQVPTDKEGLLDTAYLVLEDWSHNISFDSTEIEKERGVVVEEWRLGQGAEQRMREKYIPVILKGSRYAKRSPIGEIDVIKKFSHGRLKDFYNDWYRPELMAVIIVGDINPRRAREKIQTHFGGLDNPENSPERKAYDIPDNEKPLISIVTDEEYTRNTIQFFIKQDKQQYETIEDYRKLLLHRLYNRMFSTRFTEMRQEPNAPFTTAGSRYGSFIGRTKDAYISFAQAKNNRIAGSFRKILIENQRVRKHGFNKNELEQAKDWLISSFRQALKEKDKTESGEYVNEYRRNFLSGRPMPGIENEYAYAKKFLPQITLQDVNELADQWITDSNRVVLIRAPEKEDVKVPSEKKIEAILDSVWHAEVSPYQDTYTEQPLLDREPKKGKIKNIKRNEEFGYTEVTFENGVSAVLKPNFHKNDEILFSGYSPGGHSRYGIETYLDASYSAHIVNNSGVGKFDKTGLQRKLSGNTAKLNASINTLTEGVNGSSSTGDFETLLKLNYLYFTSPRVDTNAFQSFIADMKERVRNIENNPRFHYHDTLQKTVTMNHPRTLPAPSFEQLNSINRQTVKRIFQDRFADAGDFTFFIVGNFKVDTLLPTLEKYLGSLPSIHRKESWRNVDPEFPEGVTKFDIHKGMAPKSRVTMVMNDPFEWNDENRLQLNMLIK
ncbi:MAG: M16 family metallopeptidase, partial [Bacteroidota bacterium]